jgi:hypothetical protein
MKKYEFTGKTKNVFEATIKQIRAIRNFENVSIGDLGGWIEKESNLSHDNTAWVYGDAWVFDNAWVYGDASVHGNAKVFDNAWVYGDAKVYGHASVHGDAKVFDNAKVFGHAKVFGNAKVYGHAKVFGNAWEISPLQIQGTKHFVSISSKNTITIGCETRTVTEWRTNYSIIGKGNQYNELEIQEYKMYIDLCAQWLELHFPEEVKI